MRIENQFIRLFRNNLDDVFGQSCDERCKFVGGSAFDRGSHNTARLSADNLGDQDQSLINLYNGTGDEQLRDTMVGYWLQFAATGNPNREGLPEWPAYDSASDRCQVLDERVETVGGLRKTRLDAIDAFMNAWREETGVAAK